MTTQAMARDLHSRAAGRNERAVELRPARFI
jgi:hypothetical protein